VVEDLGARLDAINMVFAELERNRARRGRGKRSAGAAIPTSGATESLKESANKVISSASDSISSLSTNSGGSEPTRSSRTSSKASTVRTTPRSSNSASSNLSRDPLSANRRTHINKWTRRVTRSEPGDLPTTERPPRYSASARARARTRATDRTTSSPADMPIVPEDVEVSSAITLELIQNMLGIALSNLTTAQEAYKSYRRQSFKCATLESQYRKAFSTLNNVLYKSLASRPTVEQYEDTVQTYKFYAARRGQYQKEAQKKATLAEKGFQSALAETTKLSAERAEEVNVKYIRLNLAFAYEVLEKWDKAETLLRGLTVLEPTATRDAAAATDSEDDTDDPGPGPNFIHVTNPNNPHDDDLSLRACNALSALYLYMHLRKSHSQSPSTSYLSLAYTFNRRALLGRRRLFGKDHEAYRESLRLTVAIFKARGETEVAEGHAVALRKGSGRAFRNLNEVDDVVVVDLGNGEGDGDGNYNWDDEDDYKDKAKDRDSDRDSDGDIVSIRRADSSKLPKTKRGRSRHYV